MKYRLLCLMIVGVLVFTVDGLGQNKITFQKDGTGRLIKRLRNNYFVKVEDVPGDKKYNLYHDRMDETTDIMITIFNEKGIYIKDIRLVGSNNERVRGVSERDNNELIIVGSTSSRDGDFKYLTTDEFMIIINYNGTKKYSVSKLEGTYSHLDEFVITNDDKLVVSGKTITDWYPEHYDEYGFSQVKYLEYPHFTKYNTEGVLLWKILFNWYSYIYHLVNTTDNGVVTIGNNIISYGPFNYSIVKVNQYGVIDYIRPIHFEYNEYIEHLILVSDSLLIVTGRTTNYYTSDYYFIRLITTDGIKKWDSHFQYKIGDKRINEVKQRIENWYGDEVTIDTNGNFVFYNYEYEKDYNKQVRITVKKLFVINSIGVLLD